MINPIEKSVECLLQIPSRLQKVVQAYLLALMLDTSKHSQTFASKISGLHKSQFSRLLSLQLPLAQANLRQLSQTTAKKVASKRQLLMTGTPWTVALIYDATLHKRASLHTQNVQRFNHGQGFVVGHQWTNLVLLVNDVVIPLPPIPFYSKNECKRRKIPYQTEHEGVEEYLKDLDLSDWIGEHDASEVVVLNDSGYDDKVLQKRAITKGWDFISAIKINRGVQTLHETLHSPKSWRRIDKMFLAAKKQSPWETVRQKTDGGKKRKEFRARRLEGRLKGLKANVALVCSEKPRKKGRKYLACSNPKISTGAIIRTYGKRWAVELFHKMTKSRLGMLDAGVENFDSLVSHVHWVYCAYLVLLNSALEKGIGLEQRLQMLQNEAEKLPWKRHYKEVSAITTQFGGLKSLRQQCLAALQDLQAA